MNLRRKPLWRLLAALTVVVVVTVALPEPWKWVWVAIVLAAVVYGLGRVFAVISSSYNKNNP